MGRVVTVEERKASAGSGHGALMQGLARSLVDEREPAGNRGILDLLQADQTGDQRLREHRLRRNRSRSQQQQQQQQQGQVVRHTVRREPDLPSHAVMGSYYSDPVSQQLQELIDQELNRQINEHVNREIERQMQEQLQRYIDQEMEQHIMQQVMAVRGH